MEIKPNTKFLKDLGLKILEMQQDIMFMNFHPFV